MEEINVISSPAFAQSRFFVPTFVSPISQTISPIAYAFAPVGFDGAKNDGVHGILHEIVEEDKGKISLLEVSSLLFLWMQRMWR